MAKSFQNQRCGKACCRVGQIAGRIRRRTSGYRNTGPAKQSLRRRLVQKCACRGLRQGGMRSPAGGRGRCCGAGNRLQAMFEPAERHDAGVCEPVRPAFRDAFGKGAEHGRLCAGLPSCRLHRGHGRMPGLVAAAVVAREINGKDGNIDPVAHHRGESVGHLRLVAPDEGVIVQRVGQRHKRAQRLAETAEIVIRDRRPFQRQVAGQIGGQPCFAAGTAHGGDAPARKPAVEMHDFQRLHQIFG